MKEKIFTYNGGKIAVTYNMTSSLSRKGRVGGPYSGYDVIQQKYNGPEEVPEIINDKSY